MVTNSPTSIITYLQCPRLYYHRFIVGHEEKMPNMNQIKGIIAHRALQRFFDFKPQLLCESPFEWCNFTMKRIIREEWNNHILKIKRIDLTKQEISEHKHDILDMMSHWINNLLSEMNLDSAKFYNEFYKFKPIREKELYDEELDIKGYIDAIREIDGEIQIIDYKTSAKPELTKENRLQLSIYAWLYSRVIGKIPEKVGIHFLRGSLHLLPADNSLIKYADEKCRIVCELTESRDIIDYPQNEGYLCKKLMGLCPCRYYENK